LFLGWEQSRPFREFRLLSRMKAYGLAVPAPLAAICERLGLACRGAILMERIEGVDSLQKLASGSPQDLALWARVGDGLRGFHEAGVNHADLNAGNVLFDAQGKVFLVDFDRCRFHPGRPVRGESNLARLKRSLQKHWPVEKGAEWRPAWDALMKGYASSV